MLTLVKLGYILYLHSYILTYFANGYKVSLIDE